MYGSCNILLQTRPIPEFQVLMIPVLRLPWQLLHQQKHMHTWHATHVCEACDLHLQAQVKVCMHGQCQWALELETALVYI